MFPSFRHIITSCGTFAVLLVAPAGQAEERTLTFEADIQPILADKCGKCHSDSVHKGGLNLASMRGLREGGESGESSIAEDPDESMLWLMLDGGGMPPEDEPQLSDDELELIHQWLEAGAASLDTSEMTEDPVTQHDVLPILLLRCAACHGAQLQRGGVDLRSVAGVKNGGVNGSTIVPGDPDASLLIQRIESEACPPQKQLLKFFVRRPSQTEVQVLREWIEDGAQEFDIVPDVATSDPDPMVTDEDRQHWAFQPPQRPPGTHTIDEFIERSLNEHGLSFSPEAGRDTLIRRAWLDLTGLPPDLEELTTWRGREDDHWYGDMIDHLLQSPRYGERWGRYWLDLAGYADSEGGVSSDPVRQVAWKYRDYVIESFNEDKPWDRFLLEQLAGDELIDHQAAPEVTQEMVDNLIATGFLRMGIDQTGSRTMNFVPERLGVIGDAINVVGSSVMGLTLECARCHSHKYDPIPHRDYYRLKAVFQGAFDEHDWLSFRNRRLSVDTPERKARVAATNPPLQAQVKKLQGQLNRAITAWRLELLRAHYPDQPDSDRQATIRALRIADNNRTLPQRQLVEKLQKAELTADSAQPVAVLDARDVIRDLEQQIRITQEEMEPPLTIRALWDRGEPSPTYILRRGEHDKPGELVGPDVPSVLTDGRTPFHVERPFPAGTPKTGRRLAFARWLTQKSHPLTARVVVNRIWHHHFGNGLVKTLENFGVKGERPSHPQLLDWLAVEFMDRGWSVKELHRMIMTSRTYRQSSSTTEQQRQIDSSNRLLSHMPLRRMDAEALRDSLLFVSGRLNSTVGGPPDPVTVDRDGLVSVIPESDHRWRRSVYLQYRRTEIPSLMATFDYPEMGPNCIDRSISTVSPQSLMLMNNDHIRYLASEFAARVKTLSGSEADDHGRLVDTAWQLALSRLPTEDERQLGLRSLDQLTTAWQGRSDQALESFCHSLLNSAAFMYID